MTTLAYPHDLDGRRDMLTRTHATGTLTYARARTRVHTHMHTLINFKREAGSDRVGAKALQAVLVLTALRPITVTGSILGVRVLE